MTYVSHLEYFISSQDSYAKILFMTLASKIIQAIKTYSNVLPRIIGGVADAASWGSILAILMVLYPGKEASVLAGTEMVSGLGFMIGTLIENWGSNFVLLKAPPIGLFLNS